MLQRITFQVPHSMRPDLRMLPPEVPVCDWAADSVQACQEKLERYRQWQSSGPWQAQAVCSLADAESQSAMESVLPMLAGQHAHWRLDTDAAGRPQLLEVMHEGELYLQIVRGAQGVWQAVAGEARLLDMLNQSAEHCRLWWALGFILHEDMVLMRRDAVHPQQIVAECLHVSFPSGWFPLEKLGIAFEKIHAPVPDAVALQTAAPAIGRAMIERGPFERFVWTICQSPQRARLPSDLAESPPAMSSLWFRYERQVTWPLPHFGRALFFIRVYVLPLAFVCSVPARRSAIIQSLNSMSDAVIRYKGLTQIREYLNRGE
jgi:Protein of unknown function (DUF3445)